MVNFGLSDLHQVYDSGMHAVTVTPTPASAPTQRRYEALSGSTCPGVRAAVQAPRRRPTRQLLVYVSATGSYSGSASGTYVVVDKAVATVSIDGAVGGEVNRTYDGSAQVVTGTATATPSPTGTVTLTYDGDATAPTDAGSYSLQATLNDPNYTGSATGTLVIATVTGATITLDSANAGRDVRWPDARGYGHDNFTGCRLFGDLSSVTAAPTIR